MALVNSSIPYALIIPPLTDPTGPYHSISYLMGFCTEHGYPNGSAIDANISALNFAAQSSKVANLLDKAASVIAAVNEKSRISVRDQIAYRLALQVIDLDAHDITAAIDSMRNEDSFYDFSQYRIHAHKLRRWFRALSLFGMPGQYLDFRVNPYGPASPARISDMMDREFIEDIVQPFKEYFLGPFRSQLIETQPRVVGYSVTYRNQLWFTIWLAEQTKKWLPNSVVCVGGADITDLYKNACIKQDLEKVLPGVDYLVVGEGENALLTILNSVQFGTHNDQLAQNVFPLTSIKENSSFEYSNLNSASPRYDIWDYSAYWSPKPFVLYAPTRGCYWNKCTFCDYGLNFGTPTSPSRNRSVELIISDLKSIAKITPHIYFSVDAISPSHLRKICDAVIEEELDIRWAGELRLERKFQVSEVCDHLAKSGCVSISFGYESASQRVLDLIDKGVDIDRVPSLLQALRERGIAAQMMGFVGFPTESVDEGLQTYDFLLERPDDWSMAGIGEFTLTAGAIVAQKPLDYGISEVTSPEDDDVSRLKLWKDPLTGEWRGMGRVVRAFSERNWMIKRCELDRPFVGGIDSAHTVMYLDRHGPSFFREKAEPKLKSQNWDDVSEHIIPFAGVEDFFDVEKIFWSSASEMQSGRSLGLAEYREIYARECESSRFQTGKEVRVLVGVDGSIRLKSYRL